MSRPSAMMINAVRESVLIDSYTYYDNYKDLATGSPGYIGMSQCFVLSKTWTITSCKFLLSKYATPTEPVYAKLYDTTGAIGTTATPWGAARATAVLPSSSVLPTYPTQAWTEFVFPTPCVKSGSVAVAVEYQNSGAAYPIRSVRVALQSNALYGPAHPGNAAYLNILNWTPYNWGIDFYLYGY